MSEGLATSQRSNFYVPAAASRDEKNPDWTPNQATLPEKPVIVEDGHNRLMVVTGIPRGAEDHAGSTQLLFTPDHAYNQTTATFVFRDLSLSDCTGFQLEEAIINIPDSKSPEGRDLTESLCGELISGDYVTPRRWVWSESNLHVPLWVAGKYYEYNFTNSLPYGSNIDYYSLEDILEYLRTTWINFMANFLGDSTFVASFYVSNGLIRFFFGSTTYGRGVIRLGLTKYSGAVKSVLNLILRHVNVTSVRNDTQGGVDGESFGIFPRSLTPFQNNSLYMTVHSQELTQFRKEKSCIAPQSGETLIGLFTSEASGGTFDNDTSSVISGGGYIYRLVDGSLVSPKSPFDKTQTLTQFEVTLRVSADGGGFNYVLMTPIELMQSTLSLIFRVW